MLTSGVMLALSTGVVTSYLMAQQPRTPQEELTLANLEAMAVSEEDGLGPCCEPWTSHCGSVHMENGLIYDVSGILCN